MSREDYVTFKALQENRIAEGQERRASSKDEFESARQLAAQAAMILIQHSEVHYQLRGSTGWILNIYPGNRRLYRDQNRKEKSPFLKVKPDWTLIDVIHAAIASSKNTDEFAKEIQKNCATDDQIEVLAYHLWQAAGCPDGDGKSFWHQAEQQMRGR